jgi:hypothetical protein
MMTSIKFLTESPGFFDIILKVLWTLKEVVSAFALIIIISFSYRFIGYLVYLYLIKKLAQKDLDFFIHYLGTDYKYKHLGNGDKRYKWEKWMVIIKGNFDEDGKLIVSKPEPFDFFSFKTTISFK